MFGPQCPGFPPVFLCFSVFIFIFDTDGKLGFIKYRNRIEYLVPINSIFIVFMGIVSELDSEFDIRHTILSPVAW